jgi:hypothetical protein
VFAAARLRPIVRQEGGINTEDSDPDFAIH